MGLVFKRRKIEEFWGGVPFVFVIFVMHALTQIEMQVCGERLRTVGKVTLGYWLVLPLYFGGRYWRSKGSHFVCLFPRGCSCVNTLTHTSQIFEIQLTHS